MKANPSLMRKPGDPPASMPLWQLVCSGLTVVAATLACPAVRGDDEAERFFETNVRPLLIETCSGCHGEKKQSGGLRVDSLSGLLQGGDTGPAIVPGEADASVIMQAVRREDGLEMPPDEPLSSSQIAVLDKWIRQGAVWPGHEAAETSSASSIASAEHWAFQPLRKPAIAEVAGSDWTRTPVDAFVLAKLQDAGLYPSPEADRRTLIRRVSYALTGLPPTPDDVAAFVSDSDPEAYERLIDRLLESPHYGEQWARHWLDVARYSDTKGYVYAREERFWVHAWTYRDWVVRAFNSDMPYDRFLLLQLAADQVPDRAEGDLAAMGLLTLGRRFLGVERDVIDDRIDVVSRGTMGLTVACARCHDHKYDPIPTADYYSLYGVFDSCAEKLVALGELPDDEAFVSELKTRQEKLRTRLAEAQLESSSRARERVADYLHAQTELEKYPAQGFDQVFQKSDLLPAFVRSWEAHLYEADRRRDPVFVPWHAYFRIPQERFAEQAEAVTRELQRSPAGEINPIVREAFATAPGSFDEVIERYAAVFADVESRWQAAVEAASQADAQPPQALDDFCAEELRRVLYGAGAPCEVPQLPIVHVDSYFDSATVTELWGLQGEVDRWIIQSSADAPHALILVDRPAPSEPRIFLRGNPLRKGDPVPRQLLSVLAGEEPELFQDGSGRLELAQAIIDPANPLTARVFVNRVWSHLFGEGLVDTPSDFGTRAGRPSHPELLDWLASQFIADGWSVKKLHRLILASSTYRQSSRRPASATLRAAARKADPRNRLLWRMNEHRLTFEEFRDSLLAAADGLDPHLEGKPDDLFKATYPVRRSLYGLVDRQFLPSTLRMFDFANPDLHSPERPETTVPQQALFVMNHPLVLEQARALVDAVSEQITPQERVRTLFQRTYQRAPTPSELQDALRLVTAAAKTETFTPPSTAEDWQYGYAAFDEQSQRVQGFTPLPHFTGTAWQGGPEWPDPALGWVQLTATGGHPGNDRAHASVRRWTAPRAMTVEIHSKLTHEPEAGDGIRGFVVASTDGLLESASVHKQSTEFNIEELTVDAGESVDFVVDIGEGLGSDQYLWTATITQTDSSAGPTVWNSEIDFARETIPPLTPWEQLAQVLMCSNEFMFID